MRLEGILKSIVKNKPNANVIGSGGLGQSYTNRL